MQVQAVRYNTNFYGTLQVNKAFNEFKAELNDAQKKILNEHIARMEKVNDGKVYKYDYCDNGNVGIFEKSSHPFAKPWIAICTSPKEKAAWCFDELNNIYRSIICARFDEYMNKLNE